MPAKEQPHAELLARAEGVLAWSLPSGIIPSMPKLRWIQTQSAGVEGWLAGAELDPAIDLTCARGVHMEQMPDNIIAAIYYVAKPYDQARRQQERREWKRLMPEPLTGKTLGIIGLGTIGADLARRASVLGMRVIGVKPTSAPVPHVEAVHALDQLTSFSPSRTSRCCCCRSRDRACDRGARVASHERAAGCSTLTRARSWMPT